MAQTTYRLDVRLREIEPPIWRTIEIASAATLEEVHYAIQVAMGWTNSHLHQFVIGASRYGMDLEEDRELRDERRFRLQDLVAGGASFVYEYDFGDGWEHDVTVIAVAIPAKMPKPRCLAGARACPPEDCGGPLGYERLVAALADPRHPEHLSMVEWIGSYDADAFSVPKTGRDLSKGMRELAVLASHGAEDGVADDDDGDQLALPNALVEAVLALAPMQRASLAAVIAGSLATELDQIRALVAKPAAPRRHGRATSRRGRRRAR